MPSESVASERARERVAMILRARDIEKQGLDEDDPPWHGLAEWAQIEYLKDADVVLAVVSPPTPGLEIPASGPSSAPTDNTRWQGLTEEQAITRLEERLANSRRSGNVLRAHIVAAMMSNPGNSQAILLRALAVTGHEPRRPKRARRRARRLLLQAAEILEERP